VSVLTVSLNVLISNVEPLMLSFVLSLIRFPPPRAKMPPSSSSVPVPALINETGRQIDEDGYRRYSGENHGHRQRSESSKLEHTDSSRNEQQKAEEERIVNSAASEQY